MASAYRKAVSGNMPEQAEAVLLRIAVEHGLEAATHLVLRTSLDDLGRLGHNLSMALAYGDTAMFLGLPRGLVPLASVARSQALLLANASPVVIPEERTAPEEPADVALLGELVEAWEFDRVLGVLEALAHGGNAEAAYGPLLVAASADPGFLGHTLSLVHSARRAASYLSPGENAWLLWKLYRTLTTRFGYPEFLRLGSGVSIDRESVLAALESSLLYKSPPAEATVRQALEGGVPLAEVLAHVVDFYGRWTVGEKEHTIALLGAAVETARFLGRDEALLPLAVALMRLPF